MEFLSLHLEFENMFLLLLRSTLVIRDLKGKHCIVECRWEVRSGVEMCDMRNLVNYCVPLTGGSIFWPFHDIASPNLVGRYYIVKK